MVSEISKMKDTLIEQAKKEIGERGPDRIDVNRMGEIVDMIKDLAEAEKYCWEAQYYLSAVSDAMEKKYGYPMQTGNAGYSMGYDNVIDRLGEEYGKLPHDERIAMRSKVLAKLGSM